MARALSRLFRWQVGRQQSGYDKMLILGSDWPIPFDCYLLRFKPGAEIAPHVDKVESGRHFRLNIVLKQAKQGGDFHCQSTIYRSTRIFLFRPDVAEHRVSKVTSGTLYVLSIGWVRHSRGS